VPQFSPPAAASLAALTDVDVDGGVGLVNLAGLAYDGQAELWRPRSYFGGLEGNLISGGVEEIASLFPDGQRSAGVPHVGLDGDRLWRIGGASSTGSLAAPRISYYDLNTGTFTDGLTNSPASGDFPGAVVGGIPYVTRSGTPYNLYRYRVGTNSWDDLGLRPNRYGIDYCQLASFGGRVVVMNRDSLHAYSPASATWAQLPTPSGLADQYSPTMLDAGGFLYLIGGQDGNDGNTKVDRVARFNPATGAWEERAPLPTPLGEVACVYHQGILYALGGVATGGAASDGGYAYFPESNAWIELTDLVLPAATSGGSIGSYGDAIVWNPGDNVGRQFWIIR